MVVCPVIGQINVATRHIGALQRDVMALFLHGNAQRGGQCFDISPHAMRHFETWSAIDGAPQVAYVEILEVKRFQG